MYIHPHKFQVTDFQGYRYANGANLTYSAGVMKRGSKQPLLAEQAIIRLPEGSVVFNFLEGTSNSQPQLKLTHVDIYSANDGDPNSRYIKPTLTISPDTETATSPVHSGLSFLLDLEPPIENSKELSQAAKNGWSTLREHLQQIHKLARMDGQYEAQKHAALPLKGPRAWIQKWLSPSPDLHGLTSIDYAVPAHIELPALPKGISDFLTSYNAWSAR